MPEVGKRKQLEPDVMPKIERLSYGRLRDAYRTRLVKQGQGWLFEGRDEVREAKAIWIILVIILAGGVGVVIWLWVSLFLPYLSTIRNVDGLYNLDIELLFRALGSLLMTWLLLTGHNWARKRFLRVKPFAPAQVMLLARDYQAGDEVPVIFQRKLKPGETLSTAAEVLMRLSCHELVEREVGTTTEYDDALRWASPVEAVLIPRGTDVMNADASFTIPNEIIPSSTQHTTAQQKVAIQWVIAVHQQVGDFVSALTIPIQVMRPDDAPLLQPEAPTTLERLRAMGFKI